MANPTYPAAGESPWDAKLNAYLDWASAHAGRRELVLSFAGTLTAGSSTVVKIDRPTVLRGVKLSARTAATGSDIIVDVLRTGLVADATVFATGNRPRLSATKKWEAWSGRGVVFAAGDLLRVDVAGVGSTVAGADLAVTLILEDTTAEYLTSQQNTMAGASGVANGDNVSVANSGGIAGTTWSDEPTLSNSGTMTYSNTYAASGQSLSTKYVSPALANEAWASWVIPETRELYGRFLLRTPTWPTGVLNRVMQGRFQGAKAWSLGVDTAGKLKFLDSTDATVTGAGTVTTVPTAAWYRVEFRIIHEVTPGTNGSIEVRLFTTETADVTTLTSSNKLVGATGTILGGTDEVRIGRMGTGVSNQTWTHYAAGFGLGTYGWLGTV